VTDNKGLLSIPEQQAAPGRYVDTLEEFAALLLEDLPLDKVLDHLLQLTSRALSATCAVSVTVIGDDGDYITAASTNHGARAVDETQYELDEGPCIDTLRTGREHYVPVLSEESRWPGFRQRARDLGVHGVLTVPLITRGASVGALNVFARSARALEEDDLLVARRIAAPAATTLANARAYRRATRLAAQLQGALDSRALIERAKGAIMANQACSADEAFAVLRQASQRSNRKLHEVAAQLLDRATAPGPRHGASHGRGAPTVSRQGRG